MKNNFFIKIESFHSNENGKIDNVFELPPELLKKREIVYIDIANDHISSNVIFRKLYAL
jgi:hypothetical protein